MPKSNHRVTTKKPTPALLKPVKADYKELFKALGKGVGHTATLKWEDLGNDAVEAIAALGLETKPDELAFLLIRRALVKSIFDLVGESASHFSADAKKGAEELLEQADFSVVGQGIQFDKKFFDRPTELPLLKEIEPLLVHWLTWHGLGPSSAHVVAERLPSYFVYALNQEWRRNSKAYRPLLEALDTPFSKAGDREWAWTEYAALLQRRIHESVFDEPFSLSQIYIPLNAYYLEEKSKRGEGEEISHLGRSSRRVTLQLEKELDDWLQQTKLAAADAIRVISGGPGSGKSSFARIFAAHVAQTGKIKVLFVPLHLIDPAKDLEDEVGRFVREEAVLPQNPLDATSPEPNLLIIFDGLDELASQGKAAAETARAFVREVEKLVARRNQQSARLCVLLSGREVVVQENESEFRRPRQILTLLPYFTPGSKEGHKSPVVHDGDEYQDPDKLLEQDLRQRWWTNYALLTGQDFKGLPKELTRPDLDEITAQPLLNYLVALSYARGQLDFNKDINLNSIYADLVAAVHERGYEKHRAYVPIRHLTRENFARVLEEIGLAAWHGDGRSTTVSEIEEHCRLSGLSRLLEDFREGAEAGVTRLLAAFFFRRYGQRASGDPTFVFTHKSFGEYLAAQRVVRSVERIVRELERRTSNLDEGWDERETLKHWAQICGPAAISNYLHGFLLSEINLRPEDQVRQWQAHLTKLFSFMLKHGMPMEMLQVKSFKDATFQSRNAEEALLVALNLCGRKTQQVSAIEHPDNITFGTWFKRVQGQRISDESSLAARSLSFLHLTDAHLHINDFYNTDFQHSKLQNIAAAFACFEIAFLAGADLTRANVRQANFRYADLSDTNLERADFNGADLERSVLTGANLRVTDFSRANLAGAHGVGANFTGAILKAANLEGADLRNANFTGADFSQAKLTGANFAGANLTNAEFKGAIFDEKVRKQIENFSLKKAAKAKKNSQR